MEPEWTLAFLSAAREREEHRFKLDAATGEGLIEIRRPLDSIFVISPSPAPSSVWRSILQQSDNLGLSSFLTVFFLLLLSLMLCFAK